MIAVCCLLWEILKLRKQTKQKNVELKTVIKFNCLLFELIEKHGEAQENPYSLLVGEEGDEKKGRVFYKNNTKLTMNSFL